MGKEGGLFCYTSYTGKRIIKLLRPKSVGFKKVFIFPPRQMQNVYDSKKCFQDHTTNFPVVVLALLDALKAR